MRHVPRSTVRRLSLYVRCLEEMERRGTGTVSSHELAEQAGTTSAQVRKDLSHFGSFGVRGRGYSVPELLERVRAILGLNRSWGVAVVGAGRIGLALAGYPDFRRKGFHIRALFDNDPAKIGRRWGDSHVRDVAELPTAIAELGIDIVILAIPGSAAQTVADQVVAAGVRALLNFAPVAIDVAPGVELNNVNMVPELESLSFGLASRTSPAHGKTV